ncbi:MAG: hypothetical protein RJB04_892 [Verrucomicrobiota bacterium]
MGALRQHCSIRSVQNGRAIIKIDFTFGPTQRKYHLHFEIPTLSAPCGRAAGRVRLERCVSGAGSAGSYPSRAQEALGRMGFRAAREWVWCSPPRRATAKVPLPPGWCDGVWLRWGVVRWGVVGWFSGVPQRGTTYQPRVKPWVRDTPSRCVLKERRIAVQARLSASAALGVGSQTRSSAGA